MNSITLKWGTVKGWDLKSDDALEALKKWHEHGVSLSCARQESNPEQKQALVDAMDYMDEIWLDWEDKQVTRDEAKEYILNYGNDK